MPQCDVSSTLSDATMQFCCCVRGRSRPLSVLMHVLLYAKAENRQPGRSESQMSHSSESMLSRISKRQTCP